MQTSATIANFMCLWKTQLGPVYFKAAKISPLHSFSTMFICGRSRTIGTLRLPVAHPRFIASKVLPKIWYFPLRFHQLLSSLIFNFEQVISTDSDVVWNLTSFVNEATVYGAETCHWLVVENWSFVEFDRFFLKMDKLRLQIFERDDVLGHLESQSWGASFIHVFTWSSWFS